MADTFEIGSIVSCETCFKEDYQGEVIAYDPHVNILTIKSAAASGRATVCDVQLINLSYASQVKVIKEASGTALPLLPSLNLNKLNSRAKKSCDEKVRLLQAMQSGGTVDGQKIFITINKTIDDISWSGPNIVVMNEVLISPPYLPENVKDYKDVKDASSKATLHIRKIVDKYYKELQTVNGGSSSGAPTNITTAGSTVANAKIQPVSQ